MLPTLFKVTLLFVAFLQSHAAVTWKKVGCDGYAVGGVGIDEIWDNAALLATNAQAQIPIIPTKSSVFNDLGRRAGANANFMFGINFNALTGTDAAGQATMSEVSAVYTGINNGLQGNLQGAKPVTADTAVLFCGGNGLTFGAPPGWTGADVWYGTIVTDDPTSTETPPAQITEYLLLAYTLNRVTSVDGTTTIQWPHPCSEDQVPDFVTKELTYAAKTFSASSFIGDPPAVQELTAIIICPPPAARATLNLNFQAIGSAPYPDQFASVAGAIVHEMGHVYGHSQNQLWEDNDKYGFNKAYALAKSNQGGALINPDNYRIFAEMSMSPATKWFSNPRNPTV